MAIYPCRSAYTADNETIEGIRSSLEEIQENEKTLDDEEQYSPLEQDDTVDEFPETSEGEPVDPGPINVEFEPFPQEIAEEIRRLREQENELAWTYDYIPTTLDEQLHAVDQYGIRIQRTTRPPYIHPA